MSDPDSSTDWIGDEGSSEIRSWHASRDPYHAAFRMIRLLNHTKEKNFNLEHLYFLDFFLTFPFLLHRTHMRQDQRKRFNAMRIRRPKDYFMDVPSTPSLFRDMDPIQKTAISWLAGVGIIEREAFLVGEAHLVTTAVPSELLHRAEERNQVEQTLIDFIVNDFGGVSLSELREMTGLRRRILQWL